MSAISHDALRQLFLDARTHKAWQDKPVSDETLHQLYDLMKWGPTSANTSPARMVFIKSMEAKERLKPALSEGNIEKTMSAPVTVILAWSNEFYEHMAKLAPHNPDTRNWFAGKEKAIFNTAFRNSSLQGAYMIIAARALGLDCGPMSGFSEKKLNEEFFPDGKWQANFLCNIGYGDVSGLQPRAPRLDFDEACRVL